MEEKEKVEETTQKTAPLELKVTKWFKDKILGTILEEDCLII
jgi:hypothetical protein